MTTDPNGWFLASQALDHHETVGALVSAMRPARMTHDQELAEIVTTELARAGYALVRLTPAQGERAEDLTPFLSRKED